MTLKKLFFLILLTTVLFCFASPNSSSAQEPTADISPTPTPSGQAIKIDLRLPGIGSAGGNLEPKRTEREIWIYFFSPDINAENTSVKPVASQKRLMTYNGDPASELYGSFGGEYILDETIKEGTYQIVIKTPQSLAKLIRTNPNDVGGQQFEIRGAYTPALVISGQELITGDIHPSPRGDNVMDINDYNALVSCFGTKAETEACKDKAGADLDDNGIVDGIDYNIMFGNFKKLLDAGVPVPSFVKPSATPKPSITKKPTLMPTVAGEADTQVKEADTGGAGFVLVGIIFLVIIVAVVIFIWKKKPDFFTALLRKNKKSEETPQEQTGAIPAENEVVDKEFYVKQQTVDENKMAVLTLTDDNGPMLGYYKGGEVKEGFARVKGTMKKENNKVYVEIDEITPVEGS